jgi:hypothetical protein
MLLVSQFRKRQGECYSSRVGFSGDVKEEAQRGNIFERGVSWDILLGRETKHLFVQSV